MFIVVRHDITNQKAFFGAAEAITKELPKDIKPLQFLPSTDGKQAVCLWEAKSVDTVKDYLENRIGQSSKNTYYAVDSKVAMGLPVAK
jgi:DNA polymerase/3'-5' exonuclease PolX